MTNLTILLVYLAAATLLLISHLDDTESPRSKFNGALGVALAVIGFVLHSVVNYNVVFGSGSANLNVTNSLSLVGWQVALFAVVTAINRSLRGISAFLLITGALSVVANLVNTAAVNVDISSWQVQTHILLSVFAYSLLTISAFLALCMAYQDRQLRHARAGVSMRLLPPLETTEATLFNTVMAGFCLLSLAIFSGLIFVEDLGAQHLTHKTLLSIVSWIVFGILIVGRIRFGWRRKAVYWTLAAMILLAFAYFGSKFVLEVLLDKRWG